MYKLSDKVNVRKCKHFFVNICSNIILRMGREIDRQRPRNRLTKIDKKRDRNRIILGTN